MTLPPLIPKKDYIINEKTGSIDIIRLINDAYEILKEDFFNKKVFFEGKQVYLDLKILDCSVCNNQCVNTFCTCQNCPWKGKYDIFQHITSDEDKSLELRLTTKAKKALKKIRKVRPTAKIRTPGEFSSARTLRIPWIKYMIENSNDVNIQIVKKKVSKDKTKIIFYNKKENYMVVISKTILKDGFVEMYLNTAYYKPYQSLLRDFA